MAPKPIVPKKLVKFDEIPFFNLVSPIECARQMTLLDECMFAVSSSLLTALFVALLLPPFPIVTLALLDSSSFFYRIVLSVLADSEC